MSVADWLLVAGSILSAYAVTGLQILYRRRPSAMPTWLFFSIETLGVAMMVVLAGIVVTSDVAFSLIFAAAFAMRERSPALIFRALA